MWNNLSSLQSLCALFIFCPSQGNHCWYYNWWKNWRIIEPFDFRWDKVNCWGNVSFCEICFLSWANRVYCRHRWWNDSCSEMAGIWHFSLENFSLLDFVAFPNCIQLCDLVFSCRCVWTWRIYLFQCTRIS